MGEPTETLMLRTGVEAATPMVAVVQLALNRLYDEKPMAIYELVMLCRNSAHEIFSSVLSDALVKEQLVDRITDGFQVHVGIRDIVLACTKGEGAKMKLVHPINHNPKPPEKGGGNV